MNEPSTEEITDFVFGDLNADRTAQIEKLIQADPELAAKIEITRAIWLTPQADHTGPDALPSSVAKPTRLFAKKRFTLLTVAATALILLFGCWLIFYPARSGTLLTDNSDVRGIDTNGSLVGFDSFPVEWRDKARSVFQSHRFDVSNAVTDLTRDIWEKPVRSGDDPYDALVTPVNTVVRTKQPRFSWKPPMDGADSYTLQVFQLGAEEPFLTQQNLTHTSWTSDQAFEPVKIYEWNILARRGTKYYPAPALAVPKPKFMVMPSRESEHIADLEKELGGSHLLLAILYAEAGLLDQAEEQVERLKDQNPNSEFVKELERTISMQRLGRS